MGAQAEEKGYNGWRNYETWAVALWIDNEEGSQLRAVEMARDARENAEGNQYRSRDRVAVSDLADALKAWIVDEDAPDMGATLYADLLGAAFSEVDWYEVAEHYLGDLEPEEEDEDA